MKIQLRHSFKQDPKMTDYRWEVEQRRKQKELFLKDRTQPVDGNSTNIYSIPIQSSKSDVSYFFFHRFRKARKLYENTVLDNRIFLMCIVLNG